MNIAVLNEKISKINYVIENPNQIIDNLISLYINNDKSLIQNDYETNKYENDKYFDSLNKERLITIFNKILIKNADKIDFEHFKKMVLFVKEKLIWDNKFVDYVFRFVTNYKEEEILEILNYVKEDLSVNIWIVINKLFNINKIKNICY